ncbi:Flp1 family type IVb pilin [Anaerocolumna xylanovorans]|uniref:Putative Flagellin, Flp1-like, domain n=1 Tax=Anaerocolumna xylanovorans DSM 12503 TaxID=1121345 RepID=A0A1M7YMM0_9FIRM|nr:Flp1 family type IVb pilin [Anaerocolumna xylanovorans]SHO53864.1 Putative Flagellin, Flp1-like, domain [Anaerocolumna xylanovorans DSM 12503]
MNLLKEFLVEEDGVGVVEVVLILVVLIGLVIIFRDAIADVVNKVVGKITKDAGTFY